MPEVGAALRAEVRSRAKHRCEYCLVPEGFTLLSHEIDHIIAAKHGGGSGLDNLALCCTLCNKHKGTDLASINPETGGLECLFNPRGDQWHEHFELRGGQVLARTSIARVTVRLLQLNRLERIAERDGFEHRRGNLRLLLAHYAASNFPLRRLFHLRQHPLVLALAVRTLRHRAGLEPFLD